MWLLPLQAFIGKYGIDYTYLLAGEPSELQAKLPQAENLNSWPTTFFLGRDGKVSAIHAGFAAPASGEFNVALKKEVSERIERLLSDTVRASRQWVADGRDLLGSLDASFASDRASSDSGICI